MKTSKAVSQYLARHAEPEAAAADALPGELGHALVVPAYGEGESLFATLGSVPRGPDGETLIVVVLNAREDSPPEIHAANAAARARLSETALDARPVDSETPILDLRYPNGRVVVIDRAAPGRFLPEGQGVGLARKIGNDFVLRLASAGRLVSPWIHNTDADATLPNDYFEQVRTGPAKNGAAAVYFFEHRLEEDATLAEAARLYEISLRYYVLGLAWAGSPYAYEAMGSCLAIRDEAYAAVRGFPRKNAAEDFYALDKLAKTGSIARLGGRPMRLDGRISHRVPFGTGKALWDLVAKKRGLAGYRLYHPAVFAHLAAWLRVLEDSAASGGRVDLAVAELPRDNPYFRTEMLLEALEKMGAFPAMREAIARSSGDPATMRRHFHTWFDAFRTLKLVHALRDGGLVSLHYREALAEAPFTGLAASTDDDTAVLLETLAAEERKLADTPAGLTPA